MEKRKRLSPGIWAAEAAVDPEGSESYRSLADHVTLEVEEIDRMYLNVYVPGLQRERGVVNFFRFHRGNQLVSSALMDPVSKDFVAALEKDARREGSCHRPGFGAFALSHDRKPAISFWSDVFLCPWCGCNHASKSLRD